MDDARTRLFITFKLLIVDMKPRSRRLALYILILLVVLFFIIYISGISILFNPLFNHVDFHSPVQKPIELPSSITKYVDSDPFRPYVEPLTWNPRVFYVHNFMSPYECDYFVKLGTPIVQRSKTGKQGFVSTHRTSDGTFLNMQIDDPMVQMVEERIANITYFPKDHAEYLYLIRYQHGQEYKSHYDFFSHAPSVPPEDLIPGQRSATFLMYLTDVEEGGETIFPRVNPPLSIKPKRGDALFWFNVLPDGVTPDLLTEHAGTPVIKGTKWCMTKWLRESKSR